MPYANARLIHDNAAKRATLTASATSLALPPANLLTRYKTAVCRSSSTSLTLTLIWPTAEEVSAFVLPLTNMGVGAIRVRGYTNSGDTGTAFDTGTIPACPNISTLPWYWDVPLGANAFSYGAGNVARAWLPSPVSVRKVVIDLADPGNAAGYIEAAWLVVGRYWEPLKNADYGASATPLDFSINSRSGGGSLITDLRPCSSKISFTLSKMDPADRSMMWRILRSSGKSRPLYVNLFPGDADPMQEFAHQLYGKLVTPPTMSMPSFNIASASLEIEAM